MRGASFDGPSGRYGVEIAVMKHMQWSWFDLQNAPDDLVEEIVVRMSAEAHWSAEKQKQTNAMNQQLQARGLTGK